LSDASTRSGCFSAESRWIVVRPLAWSLGTLNRPPAVRNDRKSAADPPLLSKTEPKRRKTPILTHQLVVECCHLSLLGDNFTYDCKNEDFLKIFLKFTFLG